jgi:hypothetical protein
LLRRRVVRSAGEVGRGGFEDETVPRSCFQFRVLIRGIEELLEVTSQEQWTDRIRWLGLS